MTERVRTVILSGPLGREFGREFRLAVNSPAEAVRALCIMVPGFQRFLAKAKEKGLEFAVFIGRQNIAKDQLHNPPGEDIIRIAPVLVGAKRGGVLQTIIGAVLIVVGVYFGFQPAINLGVSMVIGGVVQMLSPQPKGLGAKDSAENAPSYSMNGTVNTQAQGNPAPLAYGGHDQKGMLVGSAVISGGILAEDQQ